MAPTANALAKPAMSALSLTSEGEGELIMTRLYPFRNADENLKRQVWNKGRPIGGYDPAMWRSDQCGHAMRYSDHADTNSDYGWEIDHIVPSSKGGTDHIDNLQPLFWKNNRRKGDTYPWYCENAA